MELVYATKELLMMRRVQYVYDSHTRIAKGCLRALTSAETIEAVPY